MRVCNRLVAMLLLILPAFACSGGQQWLIDSNGYTIDVTDDTPYIEPGQVVHFDFGLFKHSDETFGEPVGVDFTHVSATLRQGSATVFSIDLPAKHDRELVGFDHSFSMQNANYVLAVRYWKDGSVIADTNIPLTVGTGDPIIIAVSSIGAAIAGFFVLLLAALIIVRFFRRHSPA